MKNFLKSIWLAVCLAVISAPVAWSQATMRETTLAAAVDRTQSTISVASATGIAVGMTYVVDKESGTITSISGTTLGVNRRNNNSRHTSGEQIFVDLSNYFGLDPSGTGIPYGSCTSTSELVLPRVDTATGDVFNCTSSEWARVLNVSGLKAKLDLHLLLDTTSDDRAVRINQRNYSTITSGGSSIGFTSKPAQNVTTTGSVVGGEISPRINNTFTAANITGLHLDAYLRGTTARTISGNVRGLELELITDDAATNTISGYVTGLRMRSAFSATTITGNFSAIRIEAPETQTNSQTYDALFELTGAVAGVWDKTDVDSGDTEAGFLKIVIDGADRYIVLYSDAP